MIEKNFMSEFVLQLSSGKLIASLSGKLVSAANEYAFYFFEKNRRIGIRWYSSFPSAEFDLQSDVLSIFHAQVFVRRKGAGSAFRIIKSQKIILSSSSKRIFYIQPNIFESSSANSSTGLQHPVIVYLPL